MAEYEALDEATNWVRFASAVYAVMPFSEQGWVLPSAVQLLPFNLGSESQSELICNRCD